MTDSVVPDPYADDGGGNKLLDIAAGLKLSIETMAQHLKTANDRAQRRMLALPNRIYYEGQVGNTANTFIDVGAPQPGRIWQVRLMVVNGVSATTGTVGIYTGTNINGAPVPTSIRWIFSTFPAVKDISPGIIQVESNQHLMIVGAGQAGGTPIPVVVSYEDMPKWAQRAAVAVE